MTRVKICGITNLEDARAAVDYGADALGFVLIPESPRYIGIIAACTLLNGLPPFVQTVVLAQDSGYGYDALEHGFSALQFYSGASNSHDAWGAALIRAFSDSG